MSSHAESCMTIHRPAPSLQDPSLTEFAPFQIDIIREHDGTIWGADPQSGFLIDLTNFELQQAADLLHGQDEDLEPRDCPASFAR